MPRVEILSYHQRISQPVRQWSRMSHRAYRRTVVTWLSHDLSRTVPEFDPKMKVLVYYRWSRMEYLCSGARAIDRDFPLQVVNIRADMLVVDFEDVFGRPEVVARAFTSRLRARFIPYVLVPTEWRQMGRTRVWKSYPRIYIVTDSPRQRSRLRAEVEEMGADVLMSVSPPFFAEREPAFTRTVHAFATKYPWVYQRILAVLTLPTVWRAREIEAARTALV